MAEDRSSLNAIPSSILQTDRIRNFLIYGRPRAGRDNLVLEFIKDDIANNRGFTLLDPTGDLTGAVKDLVPNDRLVLFEPADPNGKWYLDYFDRTVDSERGTFFSVNNLVSVLEGALAPQVRFSPEISKSIYTATLAVSKLPNPSLTKVIKALEFKGDEKARLERLITDGLGKYVFDSNKQKLDLFSTIQSNKCLICDISKAKIGEVNSIFYGLLISQMLSQVASARYGLPLGQRVVHQLYVNGFENFANKDIFSMFLSESRPLGINLHLLTEILVTFDRDLLGNMFGNIGNLICFKSGKADADILAKNIGLFVPSDFTGLKDNEVVVKLVANQVVTQPRKLTLEVKQSALNEKINGYLENAKKSATDIFKVDLEMSPTSVEKLDKIADLLHRAVVAGGIEAIGGNTGLGNAGLMYGCYLGEIMKSQWGGSWMMDEKHPGDKNALALEIDGNKTFPVAKVVKRIINGPEDSLTHFYNVVEQLVSGQSGK